ncbi:hypothetical protein GIB67_030734 [Kingdonia uniflora]|uniref:Uncharacterized protein n=1 Tax=Kingdonia uniflora TaxID=39325 RepID=A0A7J7L2U6_9MAGN|nr:hypothetical protein GIB67_030734 [Kingdonia uniflora]
MECGSGFIALGEMVAPLDRKLLFVESFSNLLRLKLLDMSSLPEVGEFPAIKIPKVGFPRGVDRFKDSLLGEDQASTCSINFPGLMDSEGLLSIHPISFGAWEVYSIPRGPCFPCLIPPLEDRTSYLDDKCLIRLQKEEGTGVTGKFCSYCGNKFVKGVLCSECGHERVTS